MRFWGDLRKTCKTPQKKNGSTNFTRADLATSGESTAKINTDRSQSERITNFVRHHVWPSLIEYSQNIFSLKWLWGVPKPKSNGSWPKYVLKYSVHTCLHQKAFTSTSSCTETFYSTGFAWPTAIRSLGRNPAQISRFFQTPEINGNFPGPPFVMP